MATKDKIIKIISLPDVYKFVDHSTKVFGDVMIKRGRFIIDGKSLMGLFSIDISNPVTVTYPEDAIEFEEFIKQFEI